jgi:hypothetical protein
MYTSMTWGDTQALGSISLAIVPNASARVSPKRSGRTSSSSRTSTWTW